LFDLWSRHARQLDARKVWLTPTPNFRHNQAVISSEELGMQMMSSNMMIMAKLAKKKDFMRGILHVSLSSKRLPLALATKIPSLSPSQEATIWKAKIVFNLIGTKDLLLGR
jgi:hypothetical protein